MKRYAIVPSSGDLIREVADRCLPTGNDYSANLVVFPGKRPAHFLRKHLAEKRGSAFVPPVILSIEEFVDRVYDQSHPVACRRLETIDAVAFLFEIHRGMKSPMGGTQFLSLETFFPLGLRIYRDIEELLIERIDQGLLRAIESLVETPLPLEAGAGLQSLSFFFGRFYTMIGKESYSSRSERFRFVSEEIVSDLLPFEKIFFSGFYALTECERRLFRKVLSWDRSFFLFQRGPGIEEKLTRLGILAGSDAPEDPGLPEMEPVVHFYKSPDSHGQVFELAGVLRAQIEQEGKETEGDTAFAGLRTAGNTVIVLPTPETLFPLLYHALPLIPKEDYNISLGYPLERTPTWGFLNSLIQLLTSTDDGRLYIPDYLSLVLHPYTKNIYKGGSAEITRIIFHALEEALIENKTKSFVLLEEIEGRTDFFEQVSIRVSKSEGPVSAAEIREHLMMIHDALIRKAYAFTNIGDFAGKMMEILAFIYDHSSARLHPYFHPFAESFMNELDLLKRSRVRDLSFSERDSYFHFLRKYVAQCFTPFEGTPLRGAQVLGFLETRNLRFEHAYILDANEDVIPDTRKEDTLLPVKVRQILGMPTYKDRDTLSAYYFHTLVKGSRHVHIFFAENGRKEKSRLVEQLLWERQKKENTRDAKGYIRSLGYRLSLESAQPAAVRKTPSMGEFLESRSYDATSLDVYLKCPLQFYYRYVLNLAKREEVRSEVERLDIGRIVHRILFTYFNGKTGRRLTEDLIDLSEMRETCKRVLQEAYGPDPVGQVYLLEQQIIRQLDAFLRDYQIPLIKKIEVVILHLEHRVETVVDRFRYKGVVDRIETRNGTTCVVDYKTGASRDRLSTDFGKVDPEDRNTWNRAIGSLQLPFYLLLWEQAAGMVAEQMQAMFLLLGKVRLDEGAELALFGKNDDPAECYGKARNVILTLVREIADPMIPFDPGARAKDACKYCDFQQLCAAE